MATMVGDEVLCDALGDGETMVLLDQSQREIDAGRDARLLFCWFVIREPATE